MSTSTPPKLVTAEEYSGMEDLGYPTELVRGEIVEMNRPGFRHGRICIRIGRFLDAFAEAHDIGQVAGNDSGVVTERNPDSVRGPDVAFFSNDRIPKGEDPAGYPETMPELAIEVLSPDDRWKLVKEKIDEYLAAGVNYAVLVDPAAVTMQIFSSDGRVLELDADDQFALPDVLPGFSMTVETLIRR
jgi:Uma2 family endonuclease